MSDNNSTKTLIDIQDLTYVSVGVDADGRMHILVGGEGEHKVEIMASVTTMTGLAASITDRLTGYVAELSRRAQVAEAELARWVNSG